MMGRRCRPIGERRRRGAHTIERAVISTPMPVIVPDADEDVGLGRPWRLVVWDDPVNLMGYVVYVFRKLFGYDKAKATALMLQVHHEGRAVVSEAPRERAEFDCFQLQSHGLWATIER